MKSDALSTFIVNSTDSLWEVGLLYLATIFVASGLFTYFETMAFFDAIWMSFVTATSTGYGDLYPKTLGGRVTGVLLMHSTIFVIIPLIVVRLLNLVIRDPNEYSHEEQEHQKQQLQRIISQLENQSRTAPGDSPESTPGSNPCAVET